MTANSITIHVIDDDASFRNAIGRLLKASGYQIALYGSGAEFLKNVPVLAPGCILLDVRMPGLSGLELQEELSKRDVILPIVFLTGHGDIPTSVQAIRSGADNFLTKPVSKTTMLGAIERALVRYQELRHHQDRIGGLRTLVCSLTPREHEVFSMVVRGKLNKQIAFELGTSERTIKAHRHAVMAKLKVHSVAEAVSIAERLGMLAEPKE